jgi:hypothetical protein
LLSHSSSANFKVALLVNIKARKRDLLCNKAADEHQ